jgi:Ser/Thr protein kinase RdoA (MazF antagonist)
MMNEQQLKEVGREMAGLHDICAKIELPEVRWNFDNKTCFDAPLERIKSSFDKDPEGWEWLEKYSTRAKEVLDSIDSSKFSKGYCHYDFLPKNFHFTTDGRVTFFDFDFFGYGWLINDVMTLWQHFCMLVDAGRMTRTDADKNFNVFVEAYRESRPLSDGELSVMPWLGLGWWIFYLGFYPTHDQFFPIIQPAHLKARMTMMRRLTERYVD